MFTEFCNHHVNLILEHFYHFKYYHGNRNFNLKIKLIEFEIAKDTYLDPSLRNNVSGT